MKKKILVFILLIVGLFVITGCGKNDESEKVEKHSIGETVSTDLVDFTIETSKLAIAIDYYGDIQEYESDQQYEYVASKGHTFAWFTIILKNLDRNSLVLDSDFISVKYNGKESNALTVVSSSEDLAKWTKVRKIQVDAEKEETYKVFVDVESDAKDLEDDFDVTIRLPKSSGSSDKFEFAITKESRDKAKIREISLETAIKSYPAKASEKYFEKHIDEFETLNGAQITEYVKSNNGDRYISFRSETYKHYEFRDKGVDGNLIIWPGGTGASSFMYDVDEWKVSNDALSIRSVEYIVKKVSDNNYLLVRKSDNSIAGLMK